ncbi:MAG: DEAD/DEAH box helicase family protein, partial [Desulfobacterales bacterium]|nr:DEAD/DEAH box helicase family protein [Desulfobacterales bacterium]
YDRKMGKAAARPHQVFGVKRIVERVSRVWPGRGREGGVVWHAGGGGKFMTMAFLCKRFFLNDAFKGRRVIVASDRMDLEKRLAGIFPSERVHGGGMAAAREGILARVQTGRELVARVTGGNERILFSALNKFNTAIRLPRWRDASPDIIVLIDDGRRSRGVENHARMRRVLPNAAFIDFTAVRPLESDKISHVYGPILHAHSPGAAAADGVTTPLLYEERLTPPMVGGKGFAPWFEEASRGLTGKRKARLKRAYAKKSAARGVEDRVAWIALDVSLHFHHRVKSRGKGLKGQLVAEDKRSALLYEKHLDRIGLVESAVLISRPGVHEGGGEGKGG